MKIREFKLMILLVLGIGVGSCFEDKGNYDYEALNRVGVKLPFDATAVSRGGYLDIYPSITLNGDTLGYGGRYQYLWRILPKSTDLKEWILDSTRSLYHQMNVPVGKYILEYTIKDKETDLTWIASAAVDVKSEISQGWLLMTETQENGKKMADLDICSQSLTDGTSVVIRNLLKISGFPYREGPRSITMRGTAPGAEVTGIGTKVKSIYVLTDQACGWLDYQTQMWKDDQLIRYQMLAPEGDNYTVKKVACLDLYKVFAFTNDGGIMCYNAMTGGSVFGEEINFLSENGQQVEFRLAPYIGGPMIDGLAMLYPYVFYNETHQQFVKCEFNPYSSNNAVFYSINSDWAKTPGKTMRYMQSCGKKGDVYALLQESEGKFWKYKINVSTGLVAETPEEIDAPHLTAGSLVAFHQLYGHLYYTDGNMLYTYRSDKGEIPVKVMDAPITALATIHVPYDLSGSIDKCIAVATYPAVPQTEDSGVLTLFSTESAKPEVLSVVDAFRKTGKVVSIDYLN